MVLQLRLAVFHKAMDFMLSPINDSAVAGIHGYTLIVWSAQHQNDRQRAAYQCRRSACKKADKPSMMRRMAIVSVAKAKKMTERKTKPTRLWVPRPRRITMDHSTSDSSEDGRRKAASGTGGKFLLLATGWRHMA